jgi:dienelactone hydrolase
MGCRTHTIGRALGAALTAIVTATTVAVSATAAGAASPSGSFTGVIDGAEFRVEVPDGWNGTLLLYSHGYYPPFFPVTGVRLTNSDRAETWLLDHGYALGASNFVSPIGYQVDQGYRDQLALLDWFRGNVGEPARVISTGQSMGAAIAVRLGEQRPDLVDGVLSMCGGPDPQASLNAGLDMSFAVRTLLAPGQDIDLVHPRDAAASTAALREAIATATTAQGRARLALVASFNNVTGWWSALEPRPTDPDERIRQQALWISNAYVGGYAGPNARVDLEAKAGGNPSSNVGVDYARQLVDSGLTAQVRDAYRRAGAEADLAADLAALAAAPRIAADPAAVDFMERTSVPTGVTQVPTVTIHSVGDGGAVPDQDRWYGELVARRSGPELVRSLYVERGQHCSFSGADEVVALRVLLDRLDTGTWPSNRPNRLNAAVRPFPPEDQVVVDLSTFPFPTGIMPPAFVRFEPPVLLRPSR